MATRMGIFSDVHASAPALEAVLRALADDGVDASVFLGDAVDLGPHPREALDLLMSAPRLACVAGNHDEWVLTGLPVPAPAWLTETIRAHMEWSHERVDRGHREMLASWPRAIDQELEGVSIRHTHWDYEREAEGAVAISDPSATTMDSLFGQVPASLLFYGHSHGQGDHVGRSRYVNPGSVCTNPGGHAPYVLCDLASGNIEIEFRTAPYDRQSVIDDYERLQVPDRHGIKRRFFGVD
jgi:putative phosphoesterase